MPDSEEEIYSTMFTSLRHPVRRKILRMLSEKPMTFSKMLEDLGVSSSHLTYHLESLGELLSRNENGSYRLSTFGEASANTMRSVEETPAIQSKYRFSLPLKWRAAIAMLVIGVIVIASFSYIQYAYLDRLSDEHDELKLKYEQLLSWSAGANKAISFLRDVTQIDIEKYQATLLSDTVEQRANLGGVVEQILRYSLTNSESKIDVIFRFRNNRLSMFQIILLEGTPVYAQPQPYSVVNAAEGLLQRFRVFDDASYLEEMSNVIASVNATQNFEFTLGNTKLKVPLSEGTGEILWMYTQDGMDFSPKSLSLIYENGMLKQLTDGWFLFTIESTTVNISKEQAISIARDYVKTYTWKADGIDVSEFTVLQEPVSVAFHPTPRDSPLALVPYWGVTLYLDKIYPGGVNSLAVGVWADTGQVARVKTLSGE